MNIPEQLIPLLSYRAMLIKKVQQGGDISTLLPEISLAAAQIIELLQVDYINQHPKG